jgi:hypothetical protein
MASTKFEIDFHTGAVKVSSCRVASAAAVAGVTVHSVTGGIVTAVWTVSSRWSIFGVSLKRFSCCNGRASNGRTSNGCNGRAGNGGAFLGGSGGIGVYSL